MSGNNRSGRYSDAALTQAPLEHQRLRAVEDAFASLPERYLGADPGFQASYRIELDDLGQSWAVEMNELACEVSASPKSDPDVVIGSDAEPRPGLRRGPLSGRTASARGASGPGATSTSRSRSRASSGFRTA